MTFPFAILNATKFFVNNTCSMSWQAQKCIFIKRTMFLCFNDVFIFYCKNHAFRGKPTHCLHCAHLCYLMCETQFYSAAHAASYSTGSVSEVERHACLPPWLCGSVVSLLLIFFLAFFMALLIVQLKRVTANREREGEWHTAKGPRPGVEPGSAAEAQ